MKTKTTLCALATLMLVGCSQEPKWESLFNGKDLTGWSVKIRNYPYGENYANTFRVEDGLLKVRYDKYKGDFNNRFGHLYTDKEYSYYKFRCEYRFVGDQVQGAPAWATRNSGAMLHCPDPAGMDLDQDFPVSVESQFLGGNGKDERTTANVCTPNTDVFVDGKKLPGHCSLSKSKTFHGNQWVRMEIDVYGDSLIRHLVNGEEVLVMTNLTYTGGKANEKNVYKAGAPIRKGRIALQSESHPVDFRNIEIMDLSSQFEKKYSAQ